MMGHKMVLGLAGVIFLGACNMMGEPKTHAFRHNPIPADPMAAGTARVVMMADGMTETTLMLTGLTPNKAYAAHYHAFGPDSNTDACASNGPVTLGFPPFSANAQGEATVMVKGEQAKIAGNQGAYINVHTADNLTVVPICAPIRASK